MARPTVQLLDRHSPSSAASAGFTLLELMLTVLIGGLIISAATAVIVSQIRSSAQQEAMLRLQDHWARISLLLSNEIAEAESASTGGTDCSGVPPQLSLEVPNASGTLVPIRYAVDRNNVLWRCGPTVLQDGSLDFNTASTSRLVEGATLDASVPDGRLTTYTLTLTDPSGASFTSRESANRSRVRAIDRLPP